MVAILAGRIRLCGLLCGMFLLGEGFCFAQGSPKAKASLEGTEKEIIERLVRLEEGQKNLLREMDKRFEAVDKRFEAVDKRFEAVDKRLESLERRLDQLGDIFIGIVAAFAAIVAVTIGFAIWDRRTALKPYTERTTRVERVLKLYAQRHADLAEILRREGLL